MLSQRNYIGHYHRRALNKRQEHEMIFSLLAMGENDLSQHDRPTLLPKRQLYRILQLEVVMYNVESRVLGAMIESY